MTRPQEINGQSDNDAPHSSRDVNEWSVPTKPLWDGEDNERSGAYAQRSRSLNRKAIGEGKDLGLADTCITHTSHCFNNSGTRVRAKENQRAQVSNACLTINVGNPAVSQSDDDFSCLSQDIVDECVTTKPVSEGDRLRVEGRIAQYSQYPIPKDSGRGSGFSHVDARFTKMSRNPFPLLHGNARVCRLKYGGNPMTRSPNADRCEKIGCGYEKSAIRHAKSQSVPIKLENSAAFSDAVTSASSMSEPNCKKARIECAANSDKDKNKRPELVWEDANGGAPGSTTRRIIREMDLKNRPPIWVDYDTFSASRSKKRKKKRRYKNAVHNSALEWEGADGKPTPPPAPTPGMQLQSQTILTREVTTVAPAPPPPQPQSPSDVVTTVVQLGRRPPPPPPPPSAPDNSDDLTDSEPPGLYSADELSDVDEFSTEDSSSSDSDTDVEDYRMDIEESDEEEVPTPPLTEIIVSSDEEDDSKSEDSSSSEHDGTATPPSRVRRSKRQDQCQSKSPVTPKTKLPCAYKEKVSEVMRKMCGRRISAFYNGASHKGVVLGLAPRSLYNERQWRIKFEDRRKESTCSALELTRWLLPNPDDNLPSGMCQFIGRKVEIIKSGARLSGKVVSVIPPHKWLAEFDDGSSTTCYAQELLL